MRPSAEAIANHAASIEIGASPDAIYALVSDLTRMGEWSPENTGGHWKDGATGKAGDWFVGHNRSGEREWSREVQIAVAEPGRDFTFVVGGIEASWTWWSYELEPLDNGSTLVTELWWIVNKSPALAAATEEQFQARVAMTPGSMKATLAALKRGAEGG